jgi:DNA-binding NtrC family response regulator
VKKAGSIVTNERKTVLVVDDEEIALIVLSCFLCQEGYDVATASDGVEALEILRDNPHTSLVISDINMPGMNGMSLLREVNRQHPETAIIMVTAYGEVESYIDAMNLGAFEYLHKPVRTEELKLAMRKVLAKSVNQKNNLTIER